MSLRGFRTQPHARSVLGEMSALPGFTSIRRLGSGGLGDVFGAVRISTGSPVAIKVLRDWTDQSVAWLRAERELRALVELKGHSHVVHLEEVVVAGGVPHLVMEYAAGGSVGDLLHDRGAPLSVAEVVLIAEQTASALAASHGLNIVHLDIKPQNLLIGSWGQVKVCDFGIAALTATEQFRQQTNAVSVRYASPEQLDEEDDVGGPSDIYSLGATLAHLITGVARPLRGGDVTVQRPKLNWSVAEGADPAIKTRVDDAIQLCMSPRPSDRPTASQIQSEFESIALILGPARIRALPTVDHPLMLSRATPIRPAHHAPGTRPLGPSVPMPGSNAVWTPGRSTGPRTPVGRGIGPRPGGAGAAETRSGPRRNTGPRSAAGPARIGMTTARRRRQRRSAQIRNALLAVFCLCFVAAGGVLLGVGLLDNRDLERASENGDSSATRDQAEAELERLANLDAASAADLVDRWVPRLAVSTDGAAAPVAGVYLLQDLATEYRQLHEDFDAILLDTGSFVDDVDRYAAVAPLKFADPESVFAWCQVRNVQQERCVAYYVTRNEPAFDVVEHQIG